jgi:hypothetical protein
MRIWLTTEDTLPPRVEVYPVEVERQRLGVLEKKANTTYIGGEVVIGKEAKGDVKV